jgi:hypothetical protein
MNKKETECRVWKSRLAEFKSRKKRQERKKIFFINYLKESSTKFSIVSSIIDMIAPKCLAELKPGQYLLSGCGFDDPRVHSPPIKPRQHVVMPLAIFDVDINGHVRIIQSLFPIPNEFIIRGCTSWIFGPVDDAQTESRYFVTPSERSQLWANNGLASLLDRVFTND